MSPLAYYNEFDPAAAAWLRELIARNLIAPGDVDERSIVDVRPTDLVGYTQCHFFAGIGAWSHALRASGWADDRPVWTGSCPCQPFSSAGKGEGFDDARHLWPEFYRLIRECCPPVVFGEQVASPDGRAWLDAVCADLEASHYACGSADLCAAGVGSPHIRQRLYWVGHASGAGSQGHVGPRDVELHGAAGAVRPVATPSASGGLADADRERRDGEPVRLRPGARGRDAAGVPETAGGSASRGMADAGRFGIRGEGHGPSTGAPCGVQGPHGERQRVRPDARPGGPAPCGVADATRDGQGEERPHAGGLGAGDRQEGRAAGLGSSGGDHGTSTPHGLGGAADWLLCTDGKWRPVEPGTFPLAHGAPARVGRLRGYGNAIHAEVAATFITAYREARSMTEAA